MAKRKRDVPVLFYVSKDEMELIQQKMQAFGTSNMSAYLRKMAIDGYVLKLDLPELKEMVSLLRRWSNNLNQLTRRVHQTGRVYDADLQELPTQQKPSGTTFIRYCRRLRSNSEWKRFRRKTLCILRHSLRANIESQISAKGNPAL